MEGRPVSDILIRDVPEHVVAAIDARAATLGLSRTEYLRRRLAEEQHGPSEAVTTAHLRAFSNSFADLDDETVMADAWR